MRHGGDDSTAALGATATDPKVALGETALSDTGAPAPSPAHLAAGAKIGRYTIAGMLGSGGMGIVYRAFDPQLGRPIALKVVRPVVASAEAQDRLVREAQAMAKVTHPNVITVHDAGTLDAHVFVAMELVDGVDLAYWLEARRRGWREVVAMFEQAGRGLAAAHQAGLVHRDFKPLNVMVGRDGRVRVLDFGLARSVETPVDVVATTLPPEAGELSSLTHTGAVVGTPRYMAAEQHAGGEIDGRTDQFAFCVALFRALYHVYPFAGDTLPELMANVIDEHVSPVPPGTGVPSWLGRIVRRGLSVRPDARFPTMGALLDAIDRGIRRTRRMRWISAALVASVVFAVALIALRSRSGDAPVSRPEEVKQQQITFTGVAIQPSLSSDGRYLAFANNGTDVIVQELASGVTRRLHSASVISLIRWSPSDRELLVVSSTGIAIVPVDGGRVRQLETCPSAAWSADGSEIVVHCITGSVWVFYDARTWAARTVTAELPGAVWVSAVDWSRTTGQLLALAQQQRGVSLWTMDRTGTNAHEIFHDDLGIIDPQVNQPQVQWSSSGTRIYYARGRGQGMELGVLDYDAPAGIAREANVALAGTPLGGTTFAISADERSVVVSHVSQFSDVVTVAGGRETKVVSDALHKGRLALTRDGTLLAFVSGTGTRLRLNVVPVSGGMPIVVPSVGDAILDLAWSPDGTYLLYAASRAKTTELWRINVATKQSSQIPAPEIAPQPAIAWIRPDEVMYRRSDDGLVIVDLRTGDHRAFLAGAPQRTMGSPRPSPDGRQLVATWSGDHVSPWLFSLGDQEPTELHTADLTPVGWSRDGRTIYVADFDQRPRVLAIDVATRELRVDRDLPDAATTAVATDDALAFITGNGVSDLWLATTDEDRSPVALPSLLEAVRPQQPPTNPQPTNLGMEDGAIGAVPTGWFTSEAGDAKIAVSDQQPREGRHSMRIETTMGGAVAQRFDATPYRGKRVRFRIQILAPTSEATIDIATVIDGTRKTAGSVLTRPGGWKAVETVADILPDAEQIEISVVAHLPGKLLLDEGSFEVVAR